MDAEHSSHFPAKRISYVIRFPFVALIETVAEARELLRSLQKREPKVCPVIYRQIWVQLQKPSFPEGVAPSLDADELAAEVIADARSEGRKPRVKETYDSVFYVLRELKRHILVRLTVGRHGRRTRVII